MEDDRTDRRAAPVRVVMLELADPAQSEALFGKDVQVQRCEIIFHHMLPVPPAALLGAVAPHGVTLSFSDEEGAAAGLFVPWPQVAYVRFVGGA